MKNIVFIILLPILIIESIFAQNANNEPTELQQLKVNATATKHDTSRMMAYVDISTFFRDIQLQHDSALVYALKAEQLANKYPIYPKVPKVWYCLGRAYLELYLKTDEEKYSQLYFDKTEKAFNTCIEKSKQLGDEEFLIRGWFNINLLFSKLSNRYKYFKSSIELINHIQQKTQWNELDTFSLRKTYKNFCIHLDYDMDSKKFNDYLVKYKELISKNGNDYFKFCLLVIEQHSLLWKKTDEKKLLEEYKQYKKTIKTNYYNEELDLYLAQYYFTIKEYEKSFRLIAKYSPQNYDNINILLPHSQWCNLGRKYMIMGQNVYMLNHNQVAIHYLNKAIHYINPIENSFGLENEKYTTLLYLGKAYKKAGRYREALACNEQADVLYKQMHDVGVQALMAENDVHLEEIKQEKKLQEARTQTLLKEQEIEIQKKQKYTFLIFSILALLSAVWAVYSFIKTRKQNKTIQKQAVALAESNQLKDKIFALLSHDLRSPINRLVMSLNQSIENQRNQIQSELKGVQDILNNVLYWASMQLKGITPVASEISIKGMVESLEKEYQKILSDKKITLLNSIDSKLNIHTDENYLKIIIRNILSNALKFTAENGFIQVYGNKKNEQIEIIIKDTGRGMTQEQLNNIYNNPLPEKGTTGEKGTGLGLGLCKELAKSLKGNIEINSVINQGTKVTIVLESLPLNNKYIGEVVSIIE